MASRGRGLTRILLIALLLASSLQVATPALATTLTVCPSGCDFTDIADALEEASDGNTIAIGEGTYVGGVVMDKDISLIGADRDETTIQGTSAASVIRVKSGANVRIEAVTITGGGGSPIGSNFIGGGGILNEGELELSDSIVRDNTVATGQGRDARGGGMYSDSSKPLEIFESVISGNQAGGGGGIFVRDGDVYIQDTTVSGNQSETDGGGIHHEGSEQLQLLECIVENNRAARFGGGIFTKSGFQVTNSTVSGNQAHAGGGLASRTNERLKVVRSTISENRVTLSGGGIFVGEGGLTLIDSAVGENRSRSGAGIATEDGALSLKNSMVSGNTASDIGGGIVNRFDRKIDLVNSQVIDNRAGSLGGGVFGSARLHLRNGSVVAGNEPDQCVPVSC